MKLPGWLKRGIVAMARRLPPRLLRALPAGLRGRTLTLLGRVLMFHPVDFDQARTAFGFAIAGNTSDLLQRQVYLFGVWEPNISRWARGHLEPGDVVVDVGANVGYFSLLCAAQVGPTGRVFAFEPVPTIVALLRRNLALNGLGSVTVEHAIAAEEPGTAEIFRSPDGNLGLSATSPGEGFVSEGSVPQVRAADAIDPELWTRVRLVKVDTEGDDLRVLRGLEPLLRAMQPGAAALVEVTPEELGSRGDSPAALIDFMKAAGFDRMFAVANSYDEEAYAFDVPQDPVPLSEPPSGKADVIFVKGTGAAGR